MSTDITELRNQVMLLKLDKQQTQVTLEHAVDQIRSLQAQLQEAQRAFEEASARELEYQRTSRELQEYITPYIKVLLREAYIALDGMHIGDDVEALAAEVTDAITVVSGHFQITEVAGEAVKQASRTDSCILPAYEALVAQRDAAYNAACNISWGQPEDVVAFQIVVRQLLHMYHDTREPIVYQPLWHAARLLAGCTTSDLGVWDAEYASEGLDYIKRQVDEVVHAQV